jgi:Ribonuclease G/E
MEEFKRVEREFMVIGEHDEAKKVIWDLCSPKSDPLIVMSEKTFKELLTKANAVMKGWEVRLVSVDNLGVVFKESPSTEDYNAWIKEK